MIGIHNNSVLFLCSTNLVRSPLFAAIMTHFAEERGIADRLIINSRGTFAGLTPRAVDRRIRELAPDLDLKNHKTQQVSIEECQAAFCIVCMDEDSYWYVRREVPQYPEHKIRLACSYADNLGIREIPEPVTGEATFGEVLALGKKIAPMIFERIIRELDLARYLELIHK